MPSSQFRWRFYDEAIGWEWSMWHTHTGECPACCCWGPDDGGHLNRTAHHGDNPLVFSGHTRLDPRRIQPWRTVEWRDGDEE